MFRVRSIDQQLALLALLSYWHSALAKAPQIFGTEVNSVKPDCRHHGMNSRAANPLSAMAVAMPM
jgi:hypothetical protein